MTSPATRAPRFLIGATTVALLASLTMAQAIASDGKAPAKPDLARGQEIATQMCVACHTADGSRGSPANPILAGQHVDYLYKQLTEFKSGKRANPVMSGMAAPLTEADMRNLAAFYASKTAKPGAAKNKDTVLLGEKIYRGGIMAKQVPACAACHGPNGSGIPAQYPRLSGQHGDYIEAQMVAFRQETRKNNTQMAVIAAKMSDKEIKAVSDYIAGLR